MGYLPYQLVQDFFHQQYQFSPATNSSAPEWLVRLVILLGWFLSDHKNYGSTRQNGGVIPTTVMIIQTKISGPFSSCTFAALSILGTYSDTMRKKEVTDDTDRELTCVGMDLI